MLTLLTSQANAVILQLPIDFSFTVPGHSTVSQSIDQYFSVTNQENFPPDQQFKKQNWDSISSIIYENISPKNSEQILDKTLAIKSNNKSKYAAALF
jgi:hypothetical protein